MQVYMCKCCNEIYNSVNLIRVQLGKNVLHLCPECYEEYNAIIFKAFTAGYEKGCSANDSEHVYKKSDIKKAYNRWNEVNRAELD